MTHLRVRWKAIVARTVFGLRCSRFPKDPAKVKFCASTTGRALMACMPLCTELHLKSSFQHPESRSFAACLCITKRYSVYHQAIFCVSPSDILFITKRYSVYHQAIFCVSPSDILCITKRYSVYHQATFCLSPSDILCITKRYSVYHQAIFCVSPSDILLSHSPRCACVPPRKNSTRG
jgi:hypothetical protein